MLTFLPPAGIPTATVALSFGSLGVLIGALMVAVVGGIVWLVGRIAAEERTSSTVRLTRATTARPKMIGKAA
jgi:hypothetical protein